MTPQSISSIIRTGMTKFSTIHFTAPVSACILALLTMGSCTADQEVSLNAEGGGRIVFEINLASYLTEVIEQLKMLFPSDEELPSEDAPFFDIPAIEADFRSRRGVNLIRLESPDANSLEGEFTFADINMLMQDVKEGSVESRLIELKRRGGVTELRVMINRETVEMFLAENPSLNNPLVENYGPAANEGISDAEYLEMMEYALGTESRRGIQESTVNLRVRVEGRILDQKGGRIINKRTAVFRIPLLPLLILREPMEYSLRYR